MRTTVDIDAHLLKRLRAEAGRRGVSFKAYLNRVLHRGLEEPSPGDAEPYRCPAFGLGAPVVPLEKALSLAGALEDEEVARELALRK
jgi:hypothetical protein